MSYIIETKEVKKEKLIKILEESKIDGGDIMQTLAREWINEGMQQGMSKGKTEEKRASVVRMFNKGIALDDISDIAGLPKKEVERILEN